MLRNDHVLNSLPVLDSGTTQLCVPDQLFEQLWFHTMPYVHCVAPSFQVGMLRATLNTAVSYSRVHYHLEVHLRQ